MKFANHNSTIFSPTTDALGQSLVSDFWTVVNRWQNAADNGYGLGQWWGTSTSVALMGWDLFCGSALRNLVAITALFALWAIEIAHAPETRERLEALAAVAQAVAIATEECLSLDGELCPCIGGNVDWAAPESVALGVDDVQVHLFTAWAFGKFGRTEFDSAEVLAWAKQLAA